MEQLLQSNLQVTQKTPSLQVAWHINPAECDAADKPNQHAQPLQHRGQAQVAECDRANSCHKGRDWGADRGEAYKLG